MNQVADFFVRSAVTETTRSSMGNLRSFLIKSAETENRFFFMETRAVPGAESPPHLHYEQDEVFYILEGELEVYCMGQVRTARAGETVFLPRMQAHAFYFLSPIVHFLVLVTPGDLDGCFEAMSSPATSMEIPANVTTHTDFDPTAALAFAQRSEGKLNEVIALLAKYGVKMLTPKKRRNCCPTTLALVCRYLARSMAAHAIHKLL